MSDFEARLTKLEQAPPQRSDQAAAPTLADPWANWHAMSTPRPHATDTRPGQGSAKEAPSLGARPWVLHLKGFDFNEEEAKITKAAGHFLQELGTDPTLRPRIQVPYSRSNRAELHFANPVAADEYLTNYWNKRKDAGGGQGPPACPHTGALLRLSREQGPEQRRRNGQLWTSCMLLNAILDKIPPPDAPPARLEIIWGRGIVCLGKATVATWLKSTGVVAALKEGFLETPYAAHADLIVRRYDGGRVDRRLGVILQDDEMNPGPPAASPPPGPPGLIPAQQNIFHVATPLQKAPPQEEPEKFTPTEVELPDNESGQGFAAG